MEKEKTPIGDFLNDTGEVHALWYGFYSAWYTLDQDKLSEELKKDIDENHHYYTAGYFIGRGIKKILALWLHKKRETKNGK